MKRNFKLFLLSFALIAAFFTSCTNDEPVIEEQNIDESASITASLSELRLQFNNQGNMIPDENPTGNIVFDFCFDFVYPLDLSYNNGTTVTVNNLEDLIVVIINSNDDLYVNGIAFPFDVETYDDDSDAIVVVTINNEEEFVDLLEDCDFDEIDDCICTQDYNPVCVEVEAPDGETFLMTYPNACAAECDGFTENDFAENCEEDYNCPGGTECFTFNFPLTIITDNNETITVNSQEELDNSLYNAYYFDFVYPFDVTLTDDDDDENEVVTINNVEEFEDLLEDCFDYDDDDCDCENVAGPAVCVQIETGSGIEIITLLNACVAECLGYDSEDFVNCQDENECIECLDQEIDPVCVQVETPNGGVEIIVFPNACYAECEGFDADDFVDCEDDNNGADCSEEDISAILEECLWYAGTNLINTFIADTFTFNEDGTITITNTESEDTLTGTWETSSNPNGVVFVFLTLPAPYDVISQYDWTVVACNEAFIQLESGNNFLAFERECE
ncbi:MAG: hypothetical protein V7719_04155 [Psychroserpens sp.]|uniref:hypothetical protein n=1 Tax=Psychroserpens sp. TaxID=2020870 RepID=UPI003003A1F4